MSAWGSVVHSADDTQFDVAVAYPEWGIARVTVYEDGGDEAEAMLDLRGLASLAESLWAAITYLEERYCVGSGRPINRRLGDHRCLEHGDSDFPCATAGRYPECGHPYLMPDVSDPRCAECGRMPVAEYPLKY